MRTTTTVVILLMAAWAGCASPAGARRGGGGGLTAAEYYPLAVGNRWTYQRTLLGEAGTSVVEILRHEGGYFYDSEGGELTVDGYGVRDRKRYLLQEPIEPGRQWTNVVSASSIERYRIADVGFPCEAPAGRFEACVLVEGRNRIDDQTTLINRLTFAPGVGIVRIEVLAEARGQQVPQAQLALEAFELASPAPAEQGASPAEDRR
jgi:hypothetical protein